MVRPPFEALHLALVRPGLLCLAVVTAAGVSATTDPSAGVPPGAESPLRIPRAESPIEVDARLDEAAWANALSIPVAWEFQPREQVPAPVETECLLTWDEDAVYVAFRAHDPQPDTVRARLTDRDAAFDDDWVGVYLDTFHDRRRAFELIVNPLGVQMDLIRNEVGGGGEDASWDAIWHSAGRLTPEGYIVELAVPYTSLRFQRGEGPQTWGLVAFRHRPRSVQRKFASVPLELDVDCLLCQAQTVRGFEGAEPGRNLELDPTLTAGLTQEREGFPAGGFSDDGADVEPGLTGLWGVTPNLTLAGTINPDFSQVEADAGQLGVNERFTLFFPEKRPFFLEGADFFDTPLDVVFTRNVADPEWGVKLTGKQDRHAMGVFVAEDSVTHLVIPGSQGSSTASLDGPSTDAVVRYRRDVGASSALGVVATSREGAGYSNRVYGVDGLVRMGEADSVRFQALESRTEYPAGLPGHPAAERADGATEAKRGPLDDRAIRATYRHDDRHWSWSLGWDDRGTDFRADLGFVPRVGTRTVDSRLSRSWWGEDDDWWTRFQADADFEVSEDQSGTLLDRELELGVEMSGPWQSFVRLEWGGRDQTFRGVEFRNQEEWVAIASVRPNRSFRLFAFIKAGDAVDFANVRPASRTQVETDLELDLGRHVQIDLEHDFDRLEVDGGRLLTANLTQLSAVYQVGLRTFVRLISQYTHVDRVPSRFTFEVDETSERWFNQLLLSYKIDPKTVAFLGYSDSHLGGDEFALTRRDRTVFLKVGYALVF